MSRVPSPPRARRHPAHPLARALLLVGLLVAGAAEGQLVDSEDVLARHPADAAGASVTEVVRGAEASVNVWQVQGEIPPHLHRHHEEVIVVRSGHARARLGDQTLDLGPGDVLLVPAGTVHGARTVGEEPLVGVSVFAPPFDGADRVPAPTPTPRS